MLNVMDWFGCLGVVPDLLVLAAHPLGVHRQRLVLRDELVVGPRDDRPAGHPFVGQRRPVRDALGSTHAVTPVISSLVRWKRINAAIETGPCSFVGSRISALK